MTVRHIIPSIPRILFIAKFCYRRMHPKSVAGQIARRAMERGEIEALTPEEWDRRYGNG